jgi:hypothetical protein
MPEVTLPDGSVASFPDDMPQDQIVQAIQSHLSSTAPAATASPAPAAVPQVDPRLAAGDPEAAGAVAASQAMAPVVSELPRTAAVAGSGLARGGAELVGMPGDLTRLATAGHVAPSWLPTSPQAVDWLSRKASDVGVPLATPQTPFERYLNAAAEGVGSTLPLALIPGAGEAGLAARAGLGAAQGAAMGAGGEAGRELAPNAPALGTLAGALAGGGAAGMALGGWRPISAALQKTHWRRTRRSISRRGWPAMSPGVALGKGCSRRRCGRRVAVAPKRRWRALWTNSATRSKGPRRGSTRQAPRRRPLCRAPARPCRIRRGSG